MNAELRDALVYSYCLLTRCHGSTVAGRFEGAS